ncbi:MAG: dihydrodipicolinate synthase family protein [Ruminococcaceae bacterium]|nr:dihydrodipicolinate synthase family protein [Oscillospiraceae bacterium]
MKFEGIMPALITPLEKDGKTVNEKVARELIEHLLSQGADGFYVLGSTGEGLLLTEEERMRMCEISVSQVNGRKPVICHIAAMNFDEAIRLTKHAEKAGADAVSAIPPVFFAYRQEEIYGYYKTLATSSNLPFIIYNHSSIGGGMNAETVAKLYEIDNVTGVKWTVYNYYEMIRLKEMTHGEINIINGPDEMLLSGLSMGADAGIGTTYNVMLPRFLEIYKNFKAGNMEKANEYQASVDKVISSMFEYGVIPSVKAMCTMMGFDVGNAVKPQLQMNDEVFTAIKEKALNAGWTLEG